MSIPNIITLGRLVIVPLIISFMVDFRYGLAFWLCIVAGLSDAADGFIAKRYNMATTLGAYLDPLADKALLMSVYVTLGLQGHIQGGLVILIVSRDMLIIGAVVLSYLINHPLQIKPLWISKLNTFAQISLAVLVMADLGLGALVGDVGDWIRNLVIIVAITTVWSGGLYMLKWIKAVALWEATDDDSGQNS